jgi:hypothetical protein
MMDATIAEVVIITIGMVALAVSMRKAQEA